MKCGAENTSCMARCGEQCMEHLITDTPSSCQSKIPQTNADRIRNMSDEELARFLWEQNGGNRYWKSFEKYLDWLQQPVKDSP